MISSLRLITCLGALGSILVAPSDAQAFFRKRNGCTNSGGVVYTYPCQSVGPTQCETYQTSGGQVTVCQPTAGSSVPVTVGPGVGPSATTEQLRNALIDAIRLALDNNADDVRNKGLKQQLQELAKTLNEGNEANRKALNQELQELIKAIRELKEKK